MNLKVLLIVAALATAGAAGAQETTQSPALPLLNRVLLSGGAVYCKASYDGGLVQAYRALCYGEYTLLEFGPIRASSGVRFDFVPTFRTTPMLLLDYTGDDWFMGLEAGAGFGTGGRDLGWYVGTTFGVRIPPVGGRP